MNSLTLFEAVVTKVAAKCGGRRPTDASVIRAVRALSETIVEAAARGESVYVPGLGKFRARTDKPRRIRSPAGDVYEVAPRTVLVFRARRSVRTLRRGT